jgi:hypothetical protein
LIGLQIKERKRLNDLMLVASAVGYIADVSQQQRFLQFLFPVTALPA